MGWASVHQVDSPVQRMLESTILVNSSLMGICPFPFGCDVIISYVKPIRNWMAWCKRDISDFFRLNFSFKSAWIFACAFQFSRKTFSCTFFWLRCSCSALLRSLCTLWYFVFVLLRNKVQTSPKKYRGMVYYLIEKHMQKFRHFWRKKILPKKVTYVPLAPSHSIVP